MVAIDNNLQTKRARFRLLRERFHCCVLSESTLAVACSQRDRQTERGRASVTFICNWQCCRRARERANGTASVWASVRAATTQRATSVCQPVPN